MVKRPTANLEAYNLYLKGRHHLRQGTAEGLQKALECFERATAIDQDYAPALSGKALTLVYLSAAWNALATDETMPKARSAARRALELEPHLTEAHVAIGVVAYSDYDPRAAETAFAEALRLNPDDADAHFWYSSSLMWLDARLKEAKIHARRALELNPVDPWFQAQQTLVCYFGRDYDGAVAEGRRLTAQHPHWALGHYMLGVSLATAGHPTEAIASITRAIDLDGRGVHYVGWLGLANALAGRKADALDCLSELETREREGASVWAWQLCIYAGFDDTEQVIRCLNEAFEQRSTSLVFYLIHPLVDCVRQDARFVDLLRRMNLQHLESYRPERTWSPQASG